MIEKVISSISYGPQDRFISIAFSNFPVIEMLYRSIKVSNLSGYSLISSVRKRTEGIIEFDIPSGYFKEEDYNKHREQKNIHLEVLCLTEKIDAASTFLISGHTYSPIVTSIWEYKTGYFFDSSNSGVLENYYSGPIVAPSFSIPEAVFSSSIKDIPVAKVNIKIAAQKTISMNNGESMTLGSSEYFYVTGGFTCPVSILEENKSIFLYHGLSSIEDVFNEIRLTVRTYDEIQEYHADAISITPEYLSPESTFIDMKISMSTDRITDLKIDGIMLPLINLSIYN